MAPRTPMMVLALGLCAGLTAQPARAALQISATHVLGPDTPVDSNWTECAVRLENDEGRPVRGSVELLAPTGYGQAEAFLTQAPFAVAPGATVTVRLPTRAMSTAGGNFTVRVLDENRQPLGVVSLPGAVETAPFLVDATEPPRLAAALRGIPLSLHYDPSGSSAYRTGSMSKPLLACGSVQADPSTGDPVLPERASGYASTTLIVLRSDRLARLTGPSLEALGDYVLAGGSLALVIARPEDLHSPALISLVGAPVVSTSPAPELRRIPGETLEEPANREGSPSRPRRSGSGGTAVWPTNELADHLTGYSGGNLHPTLYGAAASYGMGEVHLLGFDPTQAPGVDDPWARSRMVDLVRHAWDRREYLVSSHGAHLTQAWSVQDVRKVLDPNESSRWAIVVAAILLCAYSVIAGPLNFTRAARRGRPLRALWILPVWSLGAFVAVMVLGTAAKGWTGKSRHLTLIEAAPGMTKAAARRYRAFFTSTTQSLSVRATDPSSVLDLATEARTGSAPFLSVDRNGVVLKSVSTMPWDTVVVREDGFSSLGAGVSVVQQDGELVITNRLARDLRAVLVFPPQYASPRQVTFFARIPDGQSRKLSEGVPVSIDPWAAATPRMDDYILEPARALLDKESKGLIAAWGALGAATSWGSSNWWPDDVPVVLAQIDGGEGTTHDSGLRMDQDRVLLRLVGYGGLP